MTIARVGFLHDEPFYFSDELSDMQYLHTMIRVADPDATVAFFKLVGLEEVRRFDSEKGRFTLVFLAAPGQKDVAEVELTYNWPPEDGSAPEAYRGGRNFGHLAYRVDDIYETCQRLMDAGVTINRPPRDGHMAFVRSPDGISVELLQDGNLPPQEPWASMPNVGSGEAKFVISAKAGTQGRQALRYVTPGSPLSRG